MPNKLRLQKTSPCLPTEKGLFKEEYVLTCVGFLQFVETLFYST